jgi:hypothetical protein
MEPLEELIAKEAVRVNHDGRWLIRRREEIPVPYRPGPPPMSQAALDLSAPTMRRDAGG